MRCERFPLSDYFDRKVKKERNQYMEYSDRVNVSEKHFQYLTALNRWRRDEQIPQIPEKTFSRYNLEKFYHYMDTSSFRVSIQDIIIYMLYCIAGYYIDDNSILDSEDLNEDQESNLEAVKRFRYKVLED